jgi:hypothetical protein
VPPAALQRCGYSMAAARRSPWSLDLGVSAVAYNERLAERIRTALGSDRNVTERKMFVGILESSLMARVGKENYTDSLGRKHVRVMDFTGKVMEVTYLWTLPGSRRKPSYAFGWTGVCSSWQRFHLKAKDESDAQIGFDKVQPRGRK